MTDKPFRVLLAAETPEDLRAFEPHYPCFVSDKIDGIRGHRRSESVMSRTMTRIPSAYVQRMFGQEEYEGFDGELLVPKQHGPTIYHDTFSAVMTHGSEEPVCWHVFDHTRIDLPYEKRYEYLLKFAHNHAGYLGPEVLLVNQVLVRNLDDVLEYEKQALDSGHEGVILRRLDAPYKQNRSTIKQGYLMKLARWLTSEAVIVGFEEMMHNDNVATTDARGFTKRSSHQAGLRPSGMLGAFIVEHPDYAGPFRLSGEMDHAFRKHAFDNFETHYKGKLATFKYKPYGTKDAPRQPIFKGLRSPEDM